MKNRNSYLKIYFVLFLLICAGNSAFAIDDLLALQGNVQQSGVNLDSGNLSVLIYDAITGGNLIYNSSTDFNNVISSGKYDVMLGNGTQTLTLEYGRIYYIEMYVNDEKFTFNGANRQILQSSTGQINNTFIGVRQVNESHLSYNINLSNATGYLSSNLVGTISLSQISGLENVSMTNQSTTWDAGTNVSVGATGWFKGAFNWVISSLTGSSFASFNGTDLWLNTTYFYNQTIIANSSQWIADGNNIRNRNSGIVNVTNGLYVAGTSEFNGGWQNNGVSIINGDVFAQSIYVLNITSLAVNNMNVNGSLIPAAGFNNTFDLGSDVWQWRNAYFATNVYVGGIAAKQWLYNQTQSAYFYNMTQSAYFYNMSNTAYFYNMSLYADNFIKNGTYPWFRYLNVSGEIVTRNINISGAGGRVGIGTASPSAPLDIYDTGTGTYSSSAAPTDTLLIQKYNNAQSNGEYTTLQFGVTSDNAAHNARGFITLVQPTFNVHAADFAFTLRDSAGAYGEKVRIQSNGYVGIGTTAPTHTLNVVGNVNVTQELIAGTYINISGNGGYITTKEPVEEQFFGFKLNAGGSDVATFQAESKHGEVRIGGISEIYYPTFYAGNVERMRIMASTGRVGIGTTSPSALLDVNGSVNIMSGGNMTMGSGKIWWDGTNGRLVIQVS